MVNVINEQKCGNVICMQNTNGDFNTLFSNIGKMLGLTPLFPTKDFCAKIEKEMHSITDDLMNALGMTAPSHSSKRPKRRKQTSISDTAATLIIVFGNNGFRDTDKDLYKKELAIYENYLNQKNAHIYFMRGNEDNPIYFEQDTFQLPHIHTLPDYSVIQAQEHNILCIGGQVSPDRVWKQKSNASLYFGETEAPKYCESIVKEILSSYPIDTILTHTAPTFLSQTQNLDKWAQIDKDLIKDTIQSQLVMDKLYHALIQNNTNNQTIEWRSNCHGLHDQTIWNLHFDISSQDEILYSSKEKTGILDKGIDLGITEPDDPMGFEMPLIHHIQAQPYNVVRHVDGAGIPYPHRLDEGEEHMAQAEALFDNL